MKYFFIQLLFFLLIYGYSQAQEAIIINHTCTDLSRIPAAWIDSVQQRMKLHYGHTSHGSQLITGLGMIEQNNSDYSFIVGDNHLPSEEGAFCIFDGQEDVLAVPTIYYWATEEGMQMTSDVLTHNPVINVSMWSWCGEMSTNNSAEVQRYIDSIEVLEARFPQVQFVYMTGHTDGSGAASGDNLRASNNQLREYCIANGKVLYDFEDIESWDPDGIYYEDTSDDCTWCTDWCNDYPEDCLTCIDCAHSHCYNCYQKGKALWWMMARLAGWSGESQSDYIEQSRGICDGDSIFIGGAYRETAGVYYDTLMNSAGNDSVIATILTLNPTYLIQKSVSICEGESIFLGGTKQTEPGTYQDAYTSIHGCDSVVETELTVYPVYNTLESASICEGESIYLGGASRTEPGICQDVYTSIHGCDSVVETELTVYPVYNILESASICEGESIYLGGANQTEPGTYQDVYTSIYGCDSIIITTLTVYPVYSIEQSVSICEGDSIYLEGAYQKTSGVYHDSFLSSGGCDSSIVTELEVYTIDSYVSVSDNTLYALAGYSYYQWIDCNADEPVPGANDSSFTPAENGSYSVEISQDGCSNSSDCLPITALDINKQVSSSNILIYPNPVSDALYLDMGKQYVDITVTIRHVNGQSINNYTYTNIRFITLNVQNLSEGIYFIHLTLDNDIRVLRMIKAN